MHQHANYFFYSEVYIRNYSHNHEPKDGDSKTGIKGKAEEQPLTPTQTIITEALSQSSGSDHLLPKWQSLQAEASPCYHKSYRANYIVPKEAKTTLDDQNLLIYDEPKTENRIICWATLNST